MADIEKSIKNLKQNNFNVIELKTKEEAKQYIIDSIPKNSAIGFGGSVTLEEIGILDHYRNTSEYDLLDRTTARMALEKKIIARETFSAEYFLTGTNAITEDGKIVNIDYTGNRVAALTYGPDYVFVVVGKNKIQPNVDSAIKHIKESTVKKNAERMDWDTPCRGMDKCLDCKSEKRMCGVTTIHEYQTIKDRISIIIIDEELGF